MTEQFIIYRDVEYQTLLDDMVELMECSTSENRNYSLMYSVVNRLVELAGVHGFQGNIWHCFLAYIIATHENAFSKACEIRGRVKGSINDMALNDFKLMRRLFCYDLSRLDECYGVKLFNILTCYSGTGGSSKVFNRRIRDDILELSEELFSADSSEQFLEAAVSFYKRYGVGRFGLHKAFRIEDKNGKADIVPIQNIEHVYLDDLIGYEIQKQKLIDNTEAFVQGKKANNCLLFGDSGTGKSTSIKAILHKYYEQGLRMIEVYKHQFQNLSSVISQIKNRNYKFIIYMDDLSFEDFEIEYKYLKAIIEGGLEVKPDNVLIYATSNRRHLIRERFSDKEEIREDLHTSDTVQEKLSLAARFGVTIYYGRPDKREFGAIVIALARRYGINMTDEELLMEANKWELSHGGISGRTAEQFITYLRGKE